MRRTALVTAIGTASAAALLALVALSGCAPAPVASGRMRVVATIFPLYDFCREVGGARVEVRLLIPAGASPHTFEPTPEVMRFISDARVFVENGLGLESWAADAAKKVGAKGLVMVDTAAAVPVDRLLPTADTGAGGEIYDPHVWLDPTLAAYEVAAIRDGLTRADPAGASYYSAHASAYLSRLQALDASVAATLAPVRGGQFISTHPSWTYFAPHYGLVQAGAVELLPGREPSLAEIKGLIDKVRELGIKVVLAEPEISSKALEVIASDSGPGVRVLKVDPLGNPDNPQVDSYENLMNYDARTIAGGML